MTTKQERYISKLIKEELNSILKESSNIPSKQDIIRFLNSTDQSSIWKDTLARHMRIIFNKYDDVDSVPTNQLYEMAVLLWNLKFVNSTDKEL